MSINFKAGFTLGTKARWNTFTSVALRVWLLAVLLLCGAGNLQAQDDSNPKRGYYPGGSYAVGEIETINRTDGNLLLNVPLVTLPAGRGGMGATLNLTYNNKLWNVSANPVYSQHPEYDQLLYTEHLLERSQTTGGWNYGIGYSWIDLESLADPCGAHGYLHKVQVTFPDGSQHEFRPYGYQDKNGYFQIGPDGSIYNYNYETCVSQGIVNVPMATTSTMTYYSTDGTYTRLDIAHDGDPAGTNPLNNPWTLYLPDGGRVVGTPASDGTLTSERIYDRNNNYIDIVKTNPQRTTISDQLGRSIIIDYQAVVGPNNLTWTDYITVQGFNNEPLQWSVHFKNINVNKSYHNCTGWSHCPDEDLVSLNEVVGVIDQVTLPSQAGGLSYSFGYNAPDYQGPGIPLPSFGWGELSSVTTPSGASASYHYKYDGIDNITWYNALNRNYPTSKDLTYQLEYDGTSTPTTETWLYSFRPDGGANSLITAPDGGVQRDYWYSDSPTWRSNLVYKTEHPDGSITERLWLDNTPSGTGSYNYSGFPIQMNPFVKTDFTSIRDSLGNLTKTAIKDYEYDKNGNVTRVSEYDWVPYGDVPRDIAGIPTGIPGTAVVKKVVTCTFYNSTPPASDITSDSPNAYNKPGSPNIRNAIASTEIGNGVSTLARSEFAYDNPATTGNLLQTKIWDSIKGGYSNPLTTSNSISVSTQYNQYGSPTLTTDPRGTQTQFTYGSVGGFGDLYPTQVTTAYGTSVQRTEAREYDFWTGLVKSATDADNGVTTSTTYDALGRPTLVRSAQGKPVESTITIQYYDQLRRVVTKSDLNSLGDAKLVAIQHYDQLGRVRLTRSLEDAGTQSVDSESDGIKVQTRYRYSGSNSYQLASNPYRAATSSAASSEPTMGWTRSKMDNGGRLIEVQTFGGGSLPSPWGGNSTGTGAVATAYDANFTTVTDQAGKLRRSMVDGLGRLRRVDEPDASGLGSTTSPVQPTNYDYDGLDNLVTVTQDIQTRTFIYDSLKRLTSATNPENGTIGYTYDANGNLTQKIDPRLLADNQTHVTVVYEYDALNRVKTRSYNDGTPAVTYTYDAGGVSNSKGRLTSVSSSVSATNYTAYDALGRLTAGNQITDGQTYAMSYSYNLGGNQISMTYPSGRMIAAEYDPAGRTAGLRDQQGGIYYAGASATDTSNRMQYSPHGAVSIMKLGNGLWEHSTFNDRLQATQIGLGTSSTDSSMMGLTNNYGTTNNNGNLQSVGYAGGGLSYTQTFGYDHLNRLTTSVESGGSWSQTNVYDRYGNRWIDLGGGNQSLYFNTANNCITNAGYAYDLAGNLKNDGVQSDVFDAENKITTVNGETDVFRYDGEGNRVRKNFAQGEKVRMVYSVGQLIAEYDLANGSLKKEYLYGAKGLLATIEPGVGTKYMTSDYLGSPRVVTGSSGSVVSRHDYKPFGEAIGSGIGSRTTGMGYDAADGLRQKFTSKEGDNETGLDYFGARYYANGQGRFTSADPFNIVLQVQPAAGINPQKAQAALQGYLSEPQQWNRYAYAINNPLLYVDPDGEAIKLSSDKDEREAQMMALREALGAAGGYLYVNQGADGNYYVGIYDHNPNGDSRSFEQVNEVASQFGAIIRDSQVATLDLVGRGNITDDSGSTFFIGRASKAGGEAPAATGYFAGHLTIKMLDWRKHDLGYLRRDLMSDGQDNMLTKSVLVAHELRHAWDLMCGIKSK